jgi:hypothetical protein
MTERKKGWEKVRKKKLMLKSEKHKTPNRNDFFGNGKIVSFTTPFIHGSNIELKYNHLNLFQYKAGAIAQSF